jgi:hypothetical protein
MTILFLTVLLSLVVAALALLHAYWGVGGLWPEHTESDLAHAVIGDGRARMPGLFACFLVAAILAAVAAWPWLILTHPKNQIAFWGGVAIALVFFLRGCAGYSLRWRARHGAEPFATRDMIIYSPLCLLLAAGFIAFLFLIRRM